MSRIIDKIAFVGDPHFASKTPSSRLDDYSITSINKLDKLLQLCLKHDIKHVVFLGDMFNTPTDTLLYVNRVMQKFKEFERNNIFVFSILGNHSVANMKHENKDKCSEGVLYTSKLVRELRYEPFISPSGYSIGLYGFHFSEPLGLPTKNDDINICVAHRGFNEPYDDALSKTACLELGFNVYALGHYHQPYDFYRDSKFTVIRPGRFMRNTADVYNYSNEVYVDVLHFNGTPLKPLLQTQRLSIEVDEYSKTFSTKVLTKSNENERYLSSLSSRVQELMERMDFDSNEERDIFDILGSLDVDYRVKDNITMYLNYIGINK